MFFKNFSIFVFSSLLLLPKKKKKKKKKKINAVECLISA